MRSPLSISFYRSGALVFGGGHVVLPLLQAEVVPPGWATNDAFLAGYGAAQAVPGPLFTFAAYLGTVMNPGPNGWLGGLLCLAAIFLPSFLLLIGALPFWDSLRRRAGGAVGAARRQRRGGRPAARGALQPGMDERDPRTRRFRDRDRGLPAAGAVGGAALAGCHPRRSRGDRGSRDRLSPAERKGDTMKRRFRLLLRSSPWSFAAAISDATAQQKPYSPGLGDLMTATVQPRHTKLGLAAREGNWPYAAYELHELKEAFDRAAKAWPKWRDVLDPRHDGLGHQGADGGARPGDQGRRSQPRHHRL